MPSKQLEYAGRERRGYVTLVRCRVFVSCCLTAVVALAVLVSSGVAWAENSNRYHLPDSRYVLSPSLRSPFLFLQDGALPYDGMRLDLSLGIAYRKAPWRLFLEPNEDFRQTPVTHRIQMRPAAAFSYRAWFELALVLPFAIQDGHGGDPIVETADPAGVDMMDIELSLRMPILHERWRGLGLAGWVTGFLPTETGGRFGASPDQATLGITLDWLRNGVAFALATGWTFRERIHTLDTTIDDEWFIRPGISYRFDVGRIRLGFALEGHFGTGTGSFFGDENDAARSLLLSVHLAPLAEGEGVYAAAGGGTGLLGDDGGYGVPDSHLEGRVGYSLEWDHQKKSHAQGAEVMR